MLCLCDQIVCYESLKRPCSVFAQIEQLPKCLDKKLKMALKPTIGQVCLYRQHRVRKLRNGGQSLLNRLSASRATKN